MSLRVGAADDAFRDRVLVGPLRGILEVRRQRQLPVEIARHSGIGPPLECRPLGLSLRFGPADVQLAEPRLIVPAGLLELLDHIAVGHESEQAVAQLPGHLGRLGTGGGDDDRRGLVGEGVDASVLDRVVAAVVALQAALPQQPDHLDRLLEHLLADVGLGPAVAEDVLVQVLAAAHAEEEAAGEHGRGGRGGLGDDRRMDSDRWARDAGPDPQPLGCLGDAAQNGPDERRVALPIDPRMKVIGDPCEVEAGLLRPARVTNQLLRAVLLAGQRVADLGHRLRITRRVRPQPVPSTTSPLSQGARGALAARWHARYGTERSPSGWSTSRSGLYGHRV